MKQCLCFLSLNVNVLFHKPPKGNSPMKHFPYKTPATDYAITEREGKKKKTSRCNVSLHSSGFKRISLFSRDVHAEEECCFSLLISRHSGVEVPQLVFPFIKRHQEKKKKNYLFKDLKKKKKIHPDVPLTFSLRNTSIVCGASQELNDDEML